MAPSSWNHSLAMIGLFMLAITNESSVRRNQVQRRRWLMHAAFAYVSVAIRSAPVTTVPVVVSVRTIVNRSARRCKDRDIFYLRPLPAVPVMPAAPWFQSVPPLVEIN